MEIKRFKNYPEKTWIELLQTLIDGSNMIMVMTNGDDIKYCKGMAAIHDLLVPLYVEHGGMDINVFNRLFQVFVYVLEFKYGDPYYEGKDIQHFVSTVDLFQQIKKNWNVDIDKELNKKKRK